jgi:hypothetical protein
MTRLRIRELAEARGLNLSQLWGAVNRRTTQAEPIALNTMRRYWYSTKDGKETGPDLELVNLDILVTIARVLGVSAGELLNEDELGQRVPDLRAAA